MIYVPYGQGRLQCHGTQDEKRELILETFILDSYYGQECKAFSYFPDGYLGDASAGCASALDFRQSQRSGEKQSFSQVLPAAAFTWWKTRCLLKMHKTKPGGGEQWLPMGNVFD